MRLVRPGGRCASIRSAAGDASRGSWYSGARARPGGELAGSCEYPGAICLQWLNDGDADPVVHAYSLARDGRRFRVIG